MNLTRYEVMKEQPPEGAVFEKIDTDSDGAQWARFSRLSTSESGVVIESTLWGFSVPPRPDRKGGAV